MARKIEVEILGDSKSLERAFGRSADSGSKFGRALGNLAKVGVVAAGAAGVGAVFGVLKAGIPEFAEAAKVAAQTEAVIKSTGGSANVTAKQVDNLAQAIMRKTGIDDEAIAAGENMLLTFTNIRNETGKGNDVFNQSTRILADMSTALGTDMSKSAIQLGKALNDPVKGVTALTRVGVTFTAGQKAQIAAMVKAGDQMGAQKLILQELNKEFGGSAEAVGKTLPGQINILKESFSNLAGTMVGALVPAVTGVVSSLTGFVNRLSAAEGAGAKFRVVLDGLKTVAGQTWTALKNAFNAIDWGQVWTVVSTKAKEGLSRAWTAVQGFVKSINWSEVGALVGRAVVTGMNKLDAFIRSVNWANVTKAAIEGFKKVVASIGQFLAGVNWGAVIGKAFHLLVAVMRAQATILLTIAKTLGAAIIKGIVAGLEGIAGFVGRKLDNVRDAVVNAAQSAYGNALGIGKAIVRGVLDGIVGLPKALGEKLGGYITSAVGWAGRKLTGSGDFQFTRHVVGKPLAEGVVRGFVDHMASAGSRIAASVAGAVRQIGSLQGQLDAINARREAQDRASAVREATTALAEARKKGEGVAAAEQALARAREGIVTASLQRRLGIEQTHLDAMKAKQTALAESMSAIVESRSAKVEAAFSRVGEMAGRAFEAKTQAYIASVSAKFDRQIAKLQASATAPTAAEQALAALDAGESERGRSRDLSEATASGDSERIRQAQIAIERARLQALAAVERTAQETAATEQIKVLEATKARELQNLTERRDQQRLGFEQHLAMMKEQLLKHPEQFKKANNEIQKLLASFRINYRTSGQLLGKEFAHGLDEAQDAVRRAAKELAKIPRDYLYMNSPAKKGPLSDFGKNWWSGMGDTLAAGMGGGRVVGASVATASAAPAASAGGGGTTVINLVVDGKVLAQVVQPELIKMGKRNGTVLGGFA